MSMIIAKIIGGLGNQMFQYASARAQAIKKNSQLCLDISGFSNYKLHQGFELQRLFNLPYEIATPKDISDALGWQSPAIVRRVISQPYCAFLRHENFVAEPHFHYWPGIKNISDNCYLSGYWQSEKYFADLSVDIREDFRFLPILQGPNFELAKQLTAETSVSVHIRRGDYINNPKNISTFQVCSLEYYQAAIKYVTERVAQPVFYIFSDDIKWVKENLKMDFPHHYLSHNQGGESYNDMRLMSLCKHHIIANSSFSWWGAWLNPDQRKIVVAPKKWFVAEFDTRDLYPPAWVRL
ncbi:alpha-1,2-fucosyltransferase [Herminiimonas sp. NPDC097707]|uniref:alpha-1,2-fucosyltransferase n=1 Tax=Herminiimonas sp. NPDC097707 TaxID=3364007 RepID=UPI00383BA9E1